MNFCERQPSVENDLWHERQPSVEGDLGRKTTFCGRQPLLEDNRRRKMTIGGRQPLEDLACCSLRFAAFSMKNKVAKNVGPQILVNNFFAQISKIKAQNQNFPNNHLEMCENFLFITLARNN